MVTRDGSPPNFSMCCWIHSRANCWSRSPAFRAPPRATSSEDRKPKAPSYGMNKRLKNVVRRIFGGASYPILNTHAYERVVVRHDNRRHILLPIVEPIATTMNPHQDRQIVSVGGRIDIEVETILIAEDEIVSWYRIEALWANRPVRYRRLHRATVQCWCLGRLPAEGPSWGCREANTVTRSIERHMHRLVIGGRNCHPLKVFNPVETLATPL